MLVCPFCSSGKPRTWCLCDWARTATIYGLPDTRRRFEAKGNVYPSATVAAERIFAAGDTSIVTVIKPSLIPLDPALLFPDGNIKELAPPGFCPCCDKRREKANGYKRTSARRRRSRLAKQTSTGADGDKGDARPCPDPGEAPINLYSARIAATRSGASARPSGASPPGPRSSRLRRGSTHT